MSPFDFINTRLMSIFRRFQFWEPTRLTVRFIPALSVTQVGRIHGYLDTDPADIPNRTIGTTTMSGNTSYRDGPLGQPMTWVYPTQGFGRKLYCNENGQNVRFSSPGHLVVRTYGSGLAANTLVGQVYLDYDIKFSVATMTATSEEVYPTSIDCFAAGAAVANLYLSSGMADTTAGEGVGIQNATPAGSTQSTAKTFTAIIDRERTSTLLPYLDERILPRGTRVWFKSATTEYDDAADTITDVNTSIWLGMLWTIQSGVWVSLRCGAAAYLYLKAVRSLGFAF
jgi:hypothetical protein